ncbi:MAG: hypothetical protein NZM26_01545 [Patescibacteria group bacterium]|nr:hypothetical protein [Patescibacteria group bacterium]
MGKTSPEQKTLSPLQQQLEEIEQRSLPDQIQAEMRVTLSQEAWETLTQYVTKNFEINRPAEEIVKDILVQLAIARKQRSVIEKTLREAQTPIEIIEALKAYGNWYQRYPKIKLTEGPFKKWEYKISSWNSPRLACQKIVDMLILDDGSINQDFINLVTSELINIRNKGDKEFSEIFLKNLPFHSCFDKDHKDVKKQEAALALCDELIKNGLAPASFYYKQTSSYPLSGNLLFLYKLYEGLSGQGICENPSEYIPENEKPEVLFDIATKIVYQVIEKIDKSGKVINFLKPKWTRGSAPYTNFIKLANRIIQLYQEQGLYTDIGFEMLNEKSLDDLPQAFLRIMHFAALVNKETTQEAKDENELENQDRLNYSGYIDLALLICEEALARKNAQKVLTIGDIAMLYPNASPEELQTIIEQLQQNNQGRMPSLGKFLRQTKTRTRITNT